MITDKVDIALATYNGSKFLPELLKSLDSQNHSNWRLIARDDNSKDSTSEILQEAGKRHPETIILPSHDRLGVIGNFNAVLDNSSAHYVMLADQDDIWLPEKIEASLVGIKIIESKFGENHPALFFTDLSVVDEKLKSISQSFWEYEKVSPNSVHSLQKLVHRNVSPGCAVIVNRALLEKTLPIPHQAMMHDWWLILTANVFGTIDYSSKPSALYRQHQNNTEGAKAYSLLNKLFRFFFAHKTIVDTTKRTQLQVREFIERFESEMDEKPLAILKAYCNYNKDNFLKHRMHCFRTGISADSLIATIGLYIAM